MDIASSSDYFHYEALRENGSDVKLIGPFPASVPAIFPESLIQRIYWRLGKKWLKYKLINTWKVSQATNRAVKEWEPDIVFSISHQPFVYYSGHIPAVYRVDTTFYGEHQFLSNYSEPILRVSMWQEKNAFQNCARIITTSEWSKNVLIDVYGVARERIRVYVNPSALPRNSVPKFIDIPGWKSLKGPLRLLLVGRDFQRKGINIAIEVTHQLNAAGIKTILTICGLQGDSNNNVRFVGPYKKNIPEELEQYVTLYRQAHLLIHPALFEPAGIVPSEAAAFGTPTITNDNGGIRTSVEPGISGIVLPKWSPAEAYVNAIHDLVNHPEVYYKLCRTTRDRYERELNWDFTGKWLVETLQEVIYENQKQMGK